jgi:valyl-tRNA synthetase
MIEPLLSKQWFVKVEPLAKEALKAVKEGRTRIVPPIWENTYYDWMENIRDWCISRQIWWGHRIPAYYCDECGDVIVSKDPPTECESCKNRKLRQETDVLDTWFSSALWPFSTLGWPDRTKELRTFYPTSVLVTGFDILFFWVARMMMMGIHFMEDIPFREVYIHALVRDAEGKKMSKSKGNVIDPLEVIEKFGTDSFRFTLAAFAAQGRDIKLSEDRIEGYRHFVNKIWNSARLVLMNLDGDVSFRQDERKYTLPDKWILTRLGQVAKETSDALEEYRFNDAAGSCYQFVWHEFCDWYLEMAKLGLYGDDERVKESTKAVLYRVLLAVLRLLHSFMPFVTEEIWQRLPDIEGSIMRASFPDKSDYIHDEKALADMDLVMNVINGVRNIRGEMNISPSKEIDAVIEAPDKGDSNIIQLNMAYIKNLGKMDSVEIHNNVPKPEASATAVFGKNQIHVLLKGLLDLDEEKKRLKKEIKKIQKDMEASNKKLSNQGFLEKAPQEIINKVRGKVESMEIKLEKLEKNLEFFEAIND